MKIERVAIEIEKELENILADSRGNQFFRAALEKTRSPEEFLGVLVNYVKYANLFASRIAGFVRVITAREGLFFDHTQSILGERNTEVAGYVLEALFDEFGDRSLPDHPNHIALSWATVIGASQYFRVDPTILRSSLFFLHDRDRRSIYFCGLGDFIVKLTRGYCLGFWAPFNHSIMRGIGFHFASESLATGEFDALQDFMERRYPDLVTYLKNTQVTIQEKLCPAYHWIQVHAGQGGVEVEHAGAALEAVRSTIAYSDKEDIKRPEELILAGAKNFSEIHEAFMENV